MIVQAFAVGPFECNCYVLADEASHEAIVVDPGGGVEAIAEFLRERELNPGVAVFTHGHIDHISGAGELKSEMGVRLLMHEGDAPLWSGLPGQAALFGLRSAPLPAVDEWLSDGQKIAFGPHAFEVAHTPGHSPGSVCLICKEAGLVLSGDTLFARSVGRTDLMGGSMPTLVRSIQTRLFVLTDDVRVLPGHGPSTTIGEERKHNPFVGEDAS